MRLASRQRVNGSNGYSVPAVRRGYKGDSAHPPSNETVTHTEPEQNGHGAACSLSDLIEEIQGVAALGGGAPSARSYNPRNGDVGASRAEAAAQ